MKSKTYSSRLLNVRTINQIDYVMFQNRYHSTIAYIRSFRGVDCETVHLKIIANCRLMVMCETTPRRKKKKSNFNIESLKEEVTRRMYEKYIIIGIENE